jgi:hypothetical protein
MQCRPGKAEGRLTFDYTVKNHGCAVAYVMEALAGAGSDAAGLVADCGNGDVLIGKLPPPLPRDRRMAVLAVPLVRTVVPGETVAGTLAVRLPLAEQNGYFPELLLREYQALEVSAVRFALGFWAEDASRMTATPIDDSLGLCRLVAPDLTGRVRVIVQRFVTRPITLFRRSDDFPRDVTETAAIFRLPETTS